MPAAYDTIGLDYAQWRRPDPGIAAVIERALGSARSVVNVGAGTGSYEPRDRAIVAVEPSLVMLRQRPAGPAHAVRGVAEALPFAAASFDASLAVLTIHHWSDWRGGLRELRRVARERVVVLTHDVHAAASTDFWLLRDYLPAVGERTLQGFPEVEETRALLGGRVEVVPVPEDCTDGFLAAYWKRPELYLEASRRDAISFFRDVPAAAVEPGLEALRRDLATGEWHRRNADLLPLHAADFGYRLIIADL